MPDADQPPERMLQRRRALRRSAAARSRGGPTGALGISVVVLDLGGVVVPTLFEIMEDPFFPAGPFGCDARYADVEHGRMQEREYWAELGRARPDLDIGTFMRERLVFRAEVTGLLADLGGRVRVAGLTNDMGHWFGADWMTRFPEFAHFDLLLEAARSGSLKPDPGVFRWALQHLQVPAEQCLFVDDLPVNLRGAAAVGMHTEHFDVTAPSPSVRRILARLGGQPRPGAERVFRSGGGTAVGR